MLETEGFTALTNDIRRMADIYDGDDEPSENVKNLMEKAGELIEKEMHNQLDGTEFKPNNRTGKLRRAIKTGKVKRRATKGHYVSVGVHRKDWKNEKDYYPAYVEFGHGGPHPAQPYPYIRSSYDRKKDEAYEMIRDGLKNLIK